MKSKKSYRGRTTKQYLHQPTINIFVEIDVYNRTIIQNILVIFVNNSSTKMYQNYQSGHLIVQISILQRIFGRSSNAKLKKKTQNIDEFELFLTEEFKNVEISVVKNCMMSMKERCLSLISSKGERIKYQHDKLSKFFCTQSYMLLTMIKRSLTSSFT